MLMIHADVSVELHADDSMLMTAMCLPNSNVDDSMPMFRMSMFHADVPVELTC
jgi:hypothetical protein